MKYSLFTKTIKKTNYLLSKKLLLFILTITFFNLNIVAQDSTAYIAGEGFGPIPDNYATIPTPAGSNLRLSGDWTIEAWVNVASNSSQIHIVESYGSGATGGFVLRLSSFSVQAYQITDPSTSAFANGTTTILANEWHHIAATLNETTNELKVYLDGSLEATTTTTLTTVNTNDNLYIGARGDDQQVDGVVEIDNVRIWDYAKTQSEIQRDTLACLTGSETGLLAMYDFENVSGTTLTDKTPNGNNGSIIQDNFSDRIYTCNPFLVNAISVESQGGVSSIDNGNTLQMEATVLPANATDDTYTWSVNNGTGSATISATGLLTATGIGTIEVTATANDASGTTGTKTITITDPTVGINDLAFKNASIYPNPTNGIVNLEIEEDLSSIKLFDLTGKMIQTFHPENTQLDVSDLTSGIYFLEIANAKKKSVIKLIKR